MKLVGLTPFLILVMLALSVSGIFDGCKGEQGPAGPTLSGDLIGSVSMVNYFGERAKDKSGVIISLTPDVASTSSLSDGSWRLTNVPAGIYDITFAKAGYYTQNIFQFQFVGGGNYTFYPETMVQVMSGSVTHLSAADTAYYIRFQGTLKYDFASGRNVYIFISKSAFKNTVPIVGSYVVYVNIISGNTFSYDLKSDYLSQFASPGDTLNAIAVFGGSGNPGVNFTPTGGEEFDTEGVPLSNDVSFVLPPFPIVG